MLSAQNIDQRLQRLEQYLAETADHVIQLRQQLDALRSELNAYRQSQPTEADARDSERIDTSGEWEAEQEGST